MKKGFLNRNANSRFLSSFFFNNRAITVTGNSFMKEFNPGALFAHPLQRPISRFTNFPNMKFLLSPFSRVEFSISKNQHTENRFDFLKRRFTRGLLLIGVMYIGMGSVVWQIGVGNTNMSTFTTTYGTSSASQSNTISTSGLTGGAVSGQIFGLK